MLQTTNRVYVKIGWEYFMFNNFLASCFLSLFCNQPVKGVNIYFSKSIYIMLQKVNSKMNCYTILPTFYI
jgi:hypothetical protein